MDWHNNVHVPLDFAPQTFLKEHPVAGAMVPQHPQDGFIHATAMCKAAGRFFGNYRQMNQFKAFLEELSYVSGIPITGPVQVIQSGIVVIFLRTRFGIIDRLSRLSIFRPLLGWELPIYGK